MTTMDARIFQVTTMDVRIFPFPDTWLARAWDWLRAEPDRNFDDAGPQTFEAFVTEMDRRCTSGETVLAVEVDTEPSGIIGFMRPAPHLAVLHGICFRRAVQGTGAARIAVARVLETLFEGGVEKVCVSYFADNARIRSFLAHLGAVDEGLLRDHTRRHGHPVDVQVVAIWPRPRTEE